MSAVEGMFAIQGIVLLAVLVTIIVLVVRRIKEKKNETFEKRDN